MDYIDESEVLTMADEDNHINKRKFTVPFVCGCRNLGEALVSWLLHFLLTWERGACAEIKCHGRVRYSRSYCDRPTEITRQTQRDDAKLT